MRREKQEFFKGKEYMLLTNELNNGQYRNWKHQVVDAFQCKLSALICSFVVKRQKKKNKELVQQDRWKTQDSRMMKKCGTRLCIPNLHSAVLIVRAILLHKLPLLS